MTLTVGVMPKGTLNPYFEDCRRGAEEAARETGFTVLWQGPPDPDAGRQVQLVERWTQDGVSAIAVSVVDPVRLSPALREARARGIKVLTWDADAEEDARDSSVVPATPEAIGHALSFEIGRITGGTGQFAAITATTSSANQNAWISAFRARVSRDHPALELVEIRPCDDVEEKAQAGTQRVVDAHPGIKAIVGFCSPAVPGAAKALERAGRRDVRVTGVSLPSLCRSFIAEGAIDSVVFWKTRDLGYLAATAAQAAATGALEPGTVLMRAGRLGNVMILKDEIRLGRCHIVTKGNLDSFN